MSNNIAWDFIIEQIDQNKCTPIIGNQVVNGSLFERNSVVRAWAKEINYPLTDSDNLTRVAQFMSVIQKDVARAKSSYLNFLRSSLLHLAEQDASFAPDFLDQLKRERSLTFSQLAADRLKYPDLSEDSEHPLKILADLDISVYLTTSPHRFLEVALRGNGKSPRTEVYAWHDGLEDNLPDDCQTDLDFIPSVESPLIYHLHGIDDYPSSLVLTEDDHLEFIVNVTRDFPKVDVIPSAVRNALASSLLLLLGYDLHAWDLRVLLQGLIRGRPHRPRSFAIQLQPDSEQAIKNLDQFEQYLREYFSQAEFDVYWGDVTGFAKSLWDKYTGN